MKCLYFGGQKSGKSSLAAARAITIATNAGTERPIYIATYDNSFGDQAMEQRVVRHVQDRCKHFDSIEQSHDLPKVIKAGETYLIDCITMWIFNNLTQEQSVLLDELAQLFTIDCDIIFVLNDVGSGVIPADPDSRRFVDLSGIIGQFIAKNCDEVFEVKYGLENKLK